MEVRKQKRNNPPQTVCTLKIYKFNCSVGPQDLIQQTLYMHRAPVLFVVHRLCCSAALFDVINSAFLGSFSSFLASTHHTLNIIKGKHLCGRTKYLLIFKLPYVNCQLKPATGQMTYLSCTPSTTT